MALTLPKPEPQAITEKQADLISQFKELMNTGG
jgi:hypothetical protein